MSYEISVGPEQITISAGECVLSTEIGGDVRQPSERGMFFRDTRLLSAWKCSVDGQDWCTLNGAAVSHYAAQMVLINPDLATDGEPIPAGSISFTLSRILGQGGMRETLALANHNRVPVRLAFEIRAVSDFSDLFDVKSHRHIERGDTASRWDDATATLTTLHRNGPFSRGLAVGAADPAGPRPSLRDGALRWIASIEPQGRWTTDLLYRVIDGDETHEAPTSSFADRANSPQAEALERWNAQAMRLASPCTALERLYAQSLEDLAALRLPIQCSHSEAFVPAAGIPWFAALFGRDSLITALQTVAVYPDFARGALEVLARYQADGTDDERDMQPGKIPHELRRGELAMLGLVPYRPYYGTADATPLYLILLHETWRFTGDRGLIDAHLDTAERCLAWIDESGDLDGDGFQEYRRRTRGGAENQGWKDSGNAILDERGDDVPAPKALCELQGYVYDAWRRMAEIYDALGRDADAHALRDKADTLHRRFNDVFWDEAAGFYALCLDPDKRPVMSVASNAGHLLWSGIVPADRAARVVARLMADDMWSGWGVRTISALHPAYNPHDYQLGAIWPHDNAIIALGFKRYGFAAEAARIVGGLLDAADRFVLNRLPEVFAGVGRDVSPFPVQYLGANVPQAWAAGSVFFCVRALLGAHVDGASRTLTLDPDLPDWLPAIRLEGMMIGTARTDLEIRRDGDRTVANLAGDGTGDATLVVRRAPRPEPAPAGA